MYPEIVISVFAISMDNTNLPHFFLFVVGGELSIIEFGLLAIRIQIGSHNRVGFILQIKTKVRPITIRIFSVISFEGVLYFPLSQVKQSGGMLRT